MTDFQIQQANSYIFGTNAPFIEELYDRYLKDPNSLDGEWKDYFDMLQKTSESKRPDVNHVAIQESFIKLAKLSQAPAQVDSWESIKKQVAVLKLISAYRFLGCQAAKLDPLDRRNIKPMDELDHKYYGLSDADLAKYFNTGAESGIKAASLSEIITHYKQTYCGNIGLEYMHILDNNQRSWVQSFFEKRRSSPAFAPEQKIRFLKKVTAAETLERYLHTRYVGQKRFSVEGGESIIVALDYLINLSGQNSVSNLVIGMAHRGRLNVLVNILGKKPANLFAEFEGKFDESLGSGDVKYHMGFSADVATENGEGVHLSLAFNPSHLEIVNPVVQGMVRAKQEDCKDTERQKIIPVLIHGDAAFAGLGVNQGTLNLSATRGYGTGGTIHFIINNQIGFTTSDSRDMRSSLFCTDIAKMIEAPIFHVNGDHPESVCLVTQAAFEFRRLFKKDVVVDIVCFRKLGHNEGDDPMVTQPMMYKKIEKHPGVRQRYADQLIIENVITPYDAENFITEYRLALDKGEHIEQTALTNYKRIASIDWQYYDNTQPWNVEVDTTIPVNDIVHLTEKSTSYPPIERDFTSYHIFP